MGVIVAIIAGVISALLIGLIGWTHLTWLSVLVGLTWLTGLILVWLFGHRGFGTGHNTDLNLFLTVLVLAAAVTWPWASEQINCANNLCAVAP